MICLGLSHKSGKSAKKKQDRVRNNSGPDGSIRSISDAETEIPTGNYQSGLFHLYNASFAMIRSRIIRRNFFWSREIVISSGGTKRVVPLFLTR